MSPIKAGGGTAVHTRQRRQPGLTRGKAKRSGGYFAGLSRGTTHCPAGGARRSHPNQPARLYSYSELITCHYGGTDPSAPLLPGGPSEGREGEPAALGQMRTLAGTARASAPPAWAASAAGTSPRQGKAPWHEEEATVPRVPTPRRQAAAARRASSPHKMAATTPPPAAMTVPSSGSGASNQLPPPR